MRIERKVLEEIAEHTRETLPRECCGILLAPRDDPAVVSVALPAKNDDQQAPELGYQLGHEVHIRAVAMEAAGEAQIVGYYHSHPTGSAAPSRRDADQAVEGVVYLIAAIRDGSPIFGAYQLAAGELLPVPLEVSE